MKKHFKDEKLQETLRIFIQDIRAIFGDKLTSVYIYGSSLHNDLSPGYGDLDFLVLLSENITMEEITRLNEQRAIYRNVLVDLYTDMLEGAFLPYKLIFGEQGRALWWGTRGERMWEKNQLDTFTMYSIKKQGLLIYGDLQEHIFPEITKEEIKGFLIEFSLCMKEHGKGGSLHSIDWLLLAAKFIGWLREEIIFSKSQAADWGLRHITSDWKEHLLKCKELRKEPMEADSQEYTEWLNKLDSVIIEASKDLDREIEEGANIL
ncbi:aminoglycoside adenylyltransferase domain-containing protein [Paenibacillus sp. SEL1]